MRVTREQAEKNRRKVLTAASRLLRQRGIDGVGVADLMNAAGLTHGAFYGQFDSKDHLVLEAAADALQQNASGWAQLRQREADPWTAIKLAYLSLAHCRHPEAGCALTALAVEGPRRGAAFQAVLTDGLNALLDQLETVMPRRRGHAPRTQAMLAFSTMLGAVVLARAVDDEDLARDLLETARQAL